MPFYQSGSQWAREMGNGNGKGGEGKDTNKNTRMGHKIPAKPRVWSICDGIIDRLSPQSGLSTHRVNGKVIGPSVPTH